MLRDASVDHPSSQPGDPGRDRDGPVPPHAPAARTQRVGAAHAARSGSPTRLDEAIPFENMQDGQGASLGRGQLPAPLRYVLNAPREGEGVHLALGKEREGQAAQVAPTEQPPEVGRRP